MKRSVFLLFAVFLQANLITNSDSKVIQNNDGKTLKNDIGVNNQLTLKSRGEGRIIGGHEIKPHSQPWLALLCSTNIKGMCNQCGGSLISPNIVLTAAHCDDKGYGMPNSQKYVLLGAHSKKHFTGTEKFVEIQKWIPHPNAVEIPGNNPYGQWDMQGLIYWDFSMLILNEKVEMTDFIHPILLPTKKDQDYEKELAYTSGWGTTAIVYHPVYGIIGINSSDVPKQAKVEVLPHDATACRENGFDSQYCNFCDHEAMICTYGVKKFNSTVVEDACQGDSGGPLFLNDRWLKPTLIGVVSFGYGCGQVNYPAVFAKVDHVLDWITGEIERYL